MSGEFTKAIAGTLPLSSFVMCSYFSQIVLECLTIPDYIKSISNGDRLHSTQPDESPFGTSCSEIAQQLITLGIVVSITTATVWRWLKAADDKALAISVLDSFDG
ncbi:MAG: hypothetical protein AB4426_18250 [Xenococcaceae cyanobacterium]